MRDNPHHGAVLLGGTWGAKLVHPQIRKGFEEAFKKMSSDRSDYYAPRTKAGHDQNILKKYIWQVFVDLTCMFIAFNLGLPNKITNIAPASLYYGKT